jgi:lipopolysaccharide assembly protein A
LEKGNRPAAQQLAAPPIGETRTFSHPDGDNSMRVIYFLILLLLFGAIGVFALQNREVIELQYLDRSVSCRLSLLIAIVYLLGMVSGWTVIGFVRRSLRRVSERPSN